MKRIGYLFDEIIDPDNLRLAFVEASRGKRCRDDQRAFQRNLNEELVRLREGLIKGDYPIGHYKRFMIHDPKEREICAAGFGERVLHHALMNVCEPYFDRALIDNSFACRKGKGQQLAVMKARKYARRYAWFMKCDFRKYFDSIAHDGVLRMLTRKFKDPYLLQWFGRILGSYEKTPGRGLPIGNLTSQHFANLYLDPLDRLAEARGFAYVRYMDDFVFWADSKAELLNLRRELTDFIHERLSLEFKEQPFVNRTALGMDFLGLRVFPSAVRLSRSARRRYLDGVRACEWACRNGKIGELECQARETSLTAFVSFADSRDWRRKNLVFCKELRARTASTAAAAGTTTPATAAPRTATGTRLATATTTSASASVAPQHRRNEIHTVPAEHLFPNIGTNKTRCPVQVGFSEGNFESSGASFVKEVACLK